MIGRLKRNLLAITVCAVLVMAAGTALGASIHGEYKGYNIVKVFVDGRELKPDVPAIIVDDRTLLPGRFLAEALGATVEFDESEYRVDVHSKPSTVPTPESSAEATTEGFYLTDKDVGIAIATPTLRREAHGAVASSGRKFLQVMLLVKNFGKQDIWISPETFSVIAGTQKYNFATATTSNTFRLIPRVVRPNDYAAGIVIFEVPEDTTYELVPAQMLYDIEQLHVPIIPENI